MNKKIIAIIGLPGSGKTEIIDHIIKKYKWPKIYFGEVTFDEMKRRKLEINEKNERFIREDLRKKYGQLHYAQQVAKKVNKSKEEHILLESLYSWEEYLFFKKKFKNKFLTIAACAAPNLRYQRLSKRPIRPLTFKEAQGRDYSQIENLHQAGPIAMADFIVDNKGTKRNLISQIDKIINQIK